MKEGQIEQLPEDIVSGNKLIAEFMGVRYYTDEAMMKIGTNDGDEICYYCEWHPEYTGKSNIIAWIYEPNKNWCQLMPVVERIVETDKKFSVEISSVGMWACFIKRDDVFEKEIADFGGFTPMITNVWLAVVKFIKWYKKENNL